MDAEAHHTVKPEGPRIASGVLERMAQHSMEAAFASVAVASGRGPSPPNPYPLGATGTSKGSVERCAAPEASTPCTSETSQSMISGGNDREGRSGMQGTCAKAGVAVLGGARAGTASPQYQVLRAQSEDAAGQQAQGEDAAGQQAQREDTTGQQAQSSLQLPGPGVLPAPPPPLIPGISEEQHAVKAQWRRGYVGEVTHYLMVTLTQGDCNMRRMRPPRPWYNVLLGGAYAQFQVEVEGGVDVGGGGSEAAKRAPAEEQGVEEGCCPPPPPRFFPKADAYEYCRTEYYLQGTETKRMFGVLGLLPGDGLLFRRGDPLPTGLPTTTLRVIRAADNPHAVPILSAAAVSACRRGSTGRGKGGAQQSGSSAGGERPAAPARKRKVSAPVRAAADGSLPSMHDRSPYPGEEEGVGEAPRAKRAARSRRFPYGEDFVTDRRQFWGGGGALIGNGGMEVRGSTEGGAGGGWKGGGGCDPNLDGTGLGERQGHTPLRGGFVPGVGSGGAGHGAMAHPLPAPVQEGVHGGGPQESPLPLHPGAPPARAIHAAGRTIVRIKLPVRRSEAGGGPPARNRQRDVAELVGQQAQQGGGSAPSVPGAPPPWGLRGEGPPTAASDSLDSPDSLDPLAALAAAAEDGVDTGRAGAGGPGQRQPFGRAAEQGWGGSGSGLGLLSKTLTRDGEGRVAGAELRLGWDPRRSSFPAISRQLSEYGMARHSMVTVEDLRLAQHGDCQLSVTLQLAQAGRVDVLEGAVRDLLAVL